MSSSTLQLELMRVVVTVVECGSFTTAAEKLYSTQSTISQQVKRLEEKVGHELLVRSSRGVELTDIGEVFFRYAKRMLILHDEMLKALSGRALVTIRLGVPEDFAGGNTTRILSQFNQKYPQVKLEVTSGLSRALTESYDHGELDIAIVKQKRNSGIAVMKWPEAMSWIDSASIPSADLDPVPLVAFPPRGLYREEMISTLEKLGRKWHISFTSSSLSGIQSAVADGMGISLIPTRAVTSMHTVLNDMKGFKTIDSFEIAILYKPTAETMVKKLAVVLGEMLDNEVGQLC